jgi:hypothetical protein
MPSAGESTITSRTVTTTNSPNATEIINASLCPSAVPAPIHVVIKRSLS